MRQPTNPKDHLDELDGDDEAIAVRLVEIAAEMELLRAERDGLLGQVLTPNLEDEKPWSYRLASLMSGVSHETLRRWYGSR